MNERDLEEARESAYRAQERYQRSRRLVLCTPDLPVGLRSALLEWHEHIFDPGHYLTTGLFQYLPESHYFHSVWKAARMLENTTGEAEKEGRVLTGIERNEITQAFLQAAERECNPKLDDDQKTQLKEIAGGISYLAGMYKNFRRIYRREEVNDPFEVQFLKRNP